MDDARARELLEEALSWQPGFKDVIGPAVTKTRRDARAHCATAPFPFNCYSSFWLYATPFQMYLPCEVREDGWVIVGGWKSHRKAEETKWEYSTVTGECVRYRRPIECDADFERTHAYGSFVDVLQQFVRDCRGGATYHPTDTWNCSAPLG